MRLFHKSTPTHDAMLPAAQVTSSQGVSLASTELNAKTTGRIMAFGVAKICQQNLRQAADHTKTKDVSPINKDHKPEPNTVSWPQSILKKLPVIKQCKKFHSAANAWKKAIAEKDEEGIRNAHKKGYEALASLSVDIAALALLLTGVGAAGSGAQAATQASTAAASRTQLMKTAATGATQLAKSDNSVIKLAKRKTLSVLVNNPKAQTLIEQLFKLVV